MKLNKTLFGSLVLVASVSLFLVNFSFNSKTANYTPRTQHFDKTYFKNLHGIAGAIEYYNERRKNIKTGKVEITDMLKAEREVAKFGKTSKQAALGLNWVEMGPDNVGGRTRALLVDKTNPARIWAGSVGGGLFVSNTGGLFWFPVNDKLNNLAITSICQSKDGDLYIGTGESFTTALGLGTITTPGIVGRGIFKSTDGGLTFDSLVSTIPSDLDNNTTAWAFINRLAADPFDNDKIYAATNRGLMLTLDGGVTWNPAVCSNPPTCSIFSTVNFEDVKIGSNGVVVASSGATTYLKKPTSTDFENISSNFLSAGSRYEFAIAPSNPDFIYVVRGIAGNMGGLWQTTDGGDNWTQQIPEGPAGVFNGQAEYNMALAVFPDDPKHVIVGGVELWAWSGTDNTWDLIALTQQFAQGLYVHADKHTVAFPPNYNSSQTYYIGCDGGVFSATVGNDLTTYTELNLGYNVTQFYAMGVSREGWVAGGTQDNGNPFIDFTGNTARSEVVNLPSGDGGYMQFSIINPTAFFWESQGGSASRSPEKNLGAGGFFAQDMCFGPCNSGTNEGPWVTPMVLWESFNDLNSTDSVRLIAKQAYNAGATLIIESNNNEFPFEYTTPVPLSVNDTVMIQDPVQNKFFVSTTKGSWMTKNVLDFSVAPSWYKISNISNATCAEFSTDGDIVYFGQGANVYRVSGLLTIGPNDAHTENTILVPPIPPGIVPETIFTSGGTQVTGIGVDPNNPENVVITTGNYGSSNHVYISSNAATTTTTNSFTSIQGDLPEMPAYDAVIEMSDNNRVIVGTEYGVWATDNAWSGNVTWTNENNNFPRVPTFMVVQQRMPNNNCTGVTVSGNIYVATHGRGIWRTETYSLKQDSIPCTLPVGIAEATRIDNFSVSLNLYPNPVVNGNAVISYELSESVDVQITLFDISGKQLKAYSLNKQTPGEHTMDLDCSDLEVGTYFVSMTAKGVRTTKRLMIL